jgi:hypothetical protein
MNDPVIEDGDTLIVEFPDHTVTIIAHSAMDDFPPSSDRPRLTWRMPRGKNKYELEIIEP